MTSLSSIAALAGSLLACCNAKDVAPDIPGPANPVITAAIAEASNRFDIPGDWIAAVVTVESGGKLDARSPKGAMGLMQIMPSTWTKLQLRYHLGNNPFDIHDNIIAGTGLLRELYDQFGKSGFLAAYNAGSSRYVASLAAGRPLSQETRHYLIKLALLLDSSLNQAVLLPIAVQDWREAPLFALAWSNENDTVPTASPAENLDRTKVDNLEFIPNAIGQFSMRPLGGEQ